MEEYLEFPIGEYAFTTEQLRVIARAEETLADACMRKYGLRYRSESSNSAAKYVAGTNRRYGVLNADVVSEYGYHFPDTPRFSGGPELSTDEVLALNGRPNSPAEVNGVAVPEGGCLGEVKKDLRGKYTDEKAVEVAQRIASESFERSLTSSVVLKTIKEWSQCMKDKGFPYGTPLQALGADENSGKEVTKREISSAKADVDCKTRTDLVRIWSGEESEIQRAMIKKNRDDLHRLAEAHHKLLAEARSIRR
ncbi:hypothetical protein [Streptomyces yerevanensis]|uniref:hypothetical protein n=1 Tax=Streptomyces yerevanensis TaxID=66378 RepID=UPI0012FEBB3E|nr:hypothetical protein [Streptomyces yerevanensis]